MTAKDLHGMLAPVARLLKIAQTAKVGDEKVKEALRQRLMNKQKRVIAAMKSGIKGGAKSVLNGVLPHKLATAKGNLQFCKDKLLQCNKERSEETDLGEGVIPGYYEDATGKPTAYKGNKNVVKGASTTTAVEDDYHRRGEEIPGEAYNKGTQKHPFKQDKRTAVQDYVHHQKKYNFIDHAPGWKFPEDRLGADTLSNMLKSARYMMKQSEEMDKAEDHAAQMKVEEANAAQLSAIKSADEAELTLQKAAEPETKASLMRRYMSTSDELYRCMRDLSRKAKDCPKVVAANDKINTKDLAPKVKKPKKDA